MSYKNLLDSKALMAFKMLKDLASEAVFVDTSVSGFNFDTGSIQKTSADPVTVKMVVIETKKKENTIIKTVLARFKDVAILDEYDTLTFESNTWKVGETLQETGRVVIFDIYREGV